jgi:two-component sensor histidine kinase
LAPAKAHDHLTKRHWAGVSLQSLIEDIVAPFAGGNGRVLVAGPPIDLNARGTQPTMSLHELASNAVKYGALSRPAGTLTVRWVVRGEPERVLQIDSAEHGGPAWLHRGVEASEHVSWSGASSTTSAASSICDSR